MAALNRHRLVNTLLAVSSVLVALAIVEIVLRSTGIVPESDQSHAHLIYEHNPDYYKLIPNLNGIPIGGIQLTTNEFGFRDRDMSLDRRPDVLRIAVLGDSWGFGWGVEYEQTIVRRLESLLRERWPNQPVELLNFSVPGYSMKHHYLVLRDEVLRFQPDHCVLLLHLNDILVESKEDRAERSWLSWERVNEEIRELKTSKLLYSRLLLPLAIRFELPNSGFVDGFRRSYSESGPYLGRYVSFVSKFVGVLDREQLGMSVYLLPLPLAQRQPYQLQSVNDIVKGIFLERGIAVTELLESYPKYPKDQLIIHPYDGHPNSFASNLLAEEICRRMVEDWSQSPVGQ